MLSKTQINKIKKGLTADNSQLTAVFHALGDTNRFQIFKLLLHKDVCVSDVANILSISSPAASQHLKILEMHGLVKRVKMKQEACYQIQMENPVIKLILSLFKKSDAKLQMHANLQK